MYDSLSNSDNMYETPLDSDNLYESPLNTENDIINSNKEIFENYIFIFNTTTEQFELILITDFENLFI